MLPLTTRTRRTNRWSGARIASFSTCLVLRRSDVFAVARSTLTFDDSVPMTRILKLSVLILCFAVVGVANTRGSRIDPKFIPVTTRLPTIDKIELQKVSGEFSIDKVLATKTLEGRDARIVAQLWRSQRYGGRNYSCHLPVYAIKFFSRGKLVVYASVCWECDNIVFIEPNLKSTLGFGADGNQGRQLLSVFKNAFP